MGDSHRIINYSKDYMPKSPKFIFFIVSIFTLVISINISANETSDSLKLPEFVAHAGGGINGITYTNSLEALNYNYKKGFRFFEVDLEWVQDNELVLMHDKGFKMPGGLTQMSLADLVKWMLKHSDTYIITDIKSNNIEGLNKIVKEYAALKGRFIPQIYAFEEYERVRDLGFKNIILTLYASNYSDMQVIDFLRNHKVLALTMLQNRANADFIYGLKTLEVFIYVHTVNDAALKSQLKPLGIDGYYTDFLNPD